MDFPTRGLFNIFSPLHCLLSYFRMMLSKKSKNYWHMIHEGKRYASTFGSCPFLNLDRKRQSKSISSTIAINGFGLLRDSHKNGHVLDCFVRSKFSTSENPNPLIYLESCKFMTLLVLDADGSNGTNHLWGRRGDAVQLILWGSVWLWSVRKMVENARRRKKTKKNSLSGEHENSKKS